MSAGWDGHRREWTFRPASSVAGARRLLPAAVLAALTAWACGSPVPADPDGLLPVNGTELYVTSIGQGEPVLVVHGGPMMDHGYLRPGLLPLSADRRLVFFDQRLNGRSAGRVDSSSVRLDTLVADMDGIRSALGLERIHLLGHSWGGLLALRYAILHPERVASLVLVSPMAPSADLWRAEESELAGRVTEAHREETARLRAAPGLSAGDTAAIAALLRHAFRLQLNDPSLADSPRLYVPPDYLERSAQFAYLGSDLSDYDFLGDLPSVRAPTLVLFGGDEPGARLGGGALAAGIPGSSLVLIPGAGHFAFLESPGVFLREVRDFWAMHRGESSG